MAALGDAQPLARQLGRIGLGCATFGREIDADTALAVMDHAFAHGISHFDTAAAYSAGGSERVVGAWLTARRPANPPLIATKIKPPYTPEAMLRAVTESRERLGIETIDLLYLHQWSEQLPTVECLAALDGFIRRGEVRSLGASNLTADQLNRLLDLQRAHAFTRLGALQNNHNFAVREVDDALRAICARESIALVTYSPLGAGFLTGKHKAGVAPGSRFEILPGHQNIYFTPLAWQRLARLETVARHTGQSLPTLALTWALNQPGTASVLVGGRSIAQVTQALHALSLGRPAWLDDLARE